MLQLQPTMQTKAQRVALGFIAIVSRSTAETDPANETLSTDINAAERTPSLQQSAKKVMPQPQLIELFVEDAALKLV